MTTINFTHSASFVGGRPYADVILNPRHSSAPTHMCLVDTGADLTQLPASAVGLSGLSLAGAVTVAVGTATGTGSLQKLPSVQISVEGYWVTVDVLFDPTNTAPAIVGRDALLAAYEIGFQPTSWLRR